MIDRNNLLGFTLLEVMLAMTLLSIMMVLLFSAMRISVQSWEAGEGRIAQVNETTQVYRFFQRHLTTARPLWSEVVEAERAFSFQGSSSALQFVSDFPASAARPGLQQFELKLIRQDNGKAIEVTMTPFFAPADGEAWQPEVAILLDHVDNFQLAYFGRDEGTGTSYWQDDWLDRNTLPALVEITIERNNEVFWPAMVIAVKMAQPTTGQQQAQAVQVE